MRTSPAQQQQQEKQKVVKTTTMKKGTAQNSAEAFRRTTAISDITLPDFNELDVKDLAPVVEAESPSSSLASSSNQSD